MKISFKIKLLFYWYKIFRSNHKIDSLIKISKGGAGVKRVAFLLPNDKKEAQLAAHFIKDDDKKNKSEDSFKINVFRENLIEDVISIIKQNGFKQVTRVKNSTHIIIKIPEPTQNQLNEFAGETKRIERSAISRIARIKSDAIQRIKAALEREYIEPHVAVPAKAHLENIQQSAVFEIRLIGLKKRKSLLGRFFSYSDEEEKKLGKKLEKSPHNDLFSN